MAHTKRLLVLYGSQTFTAQEIAEKIWRKTKILGFSGPVGAMDDYAVNSLIHEEFAIFVCSTAGQGEEPDNMKKFWKFLLKKSLPSNSLVKLKFGVLALGDSYFPKFNWVGKKLHKRLVQLGATPLLDCGLCDNQHDLGHDAVMIPWLNDYWSQLQTYYKDINTFNLENCFMPRFEVEIIKSDEKLNCEGLNEDIYFKRPTSSTVIIPKKFEIVANDRTTDESHFQDCRLITLKCADKEIMSYRPGDVFNLRPRNSKEDINELFDIFRTHELDIEPHYKICVKQFHEGMDFIIKELKR